MIPAPESLPARPTGFSPLRALLAVLVLGTALLGALPARLAAAGVMRESLETELAHGLLDAAMERLLDAGAEALARGRPVAPGEPLPLPQDCGLADARLVFTAPGHAPGEAAPAVLSVRLRLTWTASDGRPRTLELTSATR